MIAAAGPGRPGRPGRTAASAALGTLALLLASCTGAPDPSTSRADTAPGVRPTASLSPGDGVVREEPIQACDVLTAERAEQVLGSVADLPTAATTGTAGPDLAVTSCSYLSVDRDEDGARNAVGLVVRTALSAAGVAANRDRFSDAERPTGAEPVDGLGEQAFWAPELGQLNVLADDQWYVVTYGGLDPRANTLEETRAAAAVIAADLEESTP
ncbi:hypothetical protein KLP28_08255 [Nocardioidaceae bacterium]|nr:hypothetical protein KLP28_08255 [Nocardioidaceae bacterium]